MKKTLIALLVLAGMASAATTITAEFTTAPVKGGEVWSNDYVFTFTLDETYTIDNSGAVLGAYYGNQDSSETNGGGYALNAIALQEVDGELYLVIGRGVTSSSSEAGATSWAFSVDDAGISTDSELLLQSGNYSQKVNTDVQTFILQTYVTSTTAIEKGVTYTVSVDGANSSMTPTLSWGGGNSETLNSYNGNMNGNTGSDNLFGIAVNPGSLVPEPATASLSLLGLAALMIRRRRA